ncbi:MAG: hypothetical protein JST11_20175 [Acidobacteria bacterium]|nr:hypothetical protein [Acidobacteriota bacterium]
MPRRRFENWEHFLADTPEYSIGLEVIDDLPGRRMNRIHFDHHAGVVREATMSAAMQAYIAVRQGRLMERWLPHRCPLPVYVWNADQDVCLASFILEYHGLLEQFHCDPLLRWIVQFNNKIDVCGGLYPIDLAELVRNHFTWVFDPYRRQRMQGKTDGDEALVCRTIRRVCDRLEDLLNGKAGIAPITAEPEILYASPHGFVIVDEKGDPQSRLVLAAYRYTNLISLICRRATGRYTYSVIRGSPYDEDRFQVSKLIQAFQAAEDLPDARIWGGSNLAAGSDSELGSSLHWTKIRDIAEAIVGEASRNAPPESGAGAPRSGVLVVMGPAETVRVHGLLRECGVDVFTASSCAEASRALRLGVPIRAIFAARQLPDGGPHELVQMTRGRADPVPVVLFQTETDGGWIDLLEAGVFELVVEPYGRERIEQVVAALPLYSCKPPGSSTLAAPAMAATRRTA